MRWRRGMPFLFSAFIVLLGPKQAELCAAEPGKADSGAASWPQWRGPNRDGVAAPGPKLLDAWPADGPKLLWKSEPIPCSENGKLATEGGSGSPVVVDGKVLLYVNWKKKTDAKVVVTTPWLKELGWAESVPEDLAGKIESARLSSERAKLSGAELEAYVTQFVARLDPKPEALIQAHIQQRLNQGADACNWKQLTRLAEVRDKEFASYDELWKATGGILNSGAHGSGGSVQTVTKVAIPLLDKIYRYTDTILCLDAATGKEVWRQELPSAVPDGCCTALFWGGSSTPAVSGERCYVVGSAGLYCVSVKDGALVWQAKTLFSHSSPLVAGDAVYFIDGGTTLETLHGASALAAFDAKTGAPLWRQPKVQNTDGSVALWTHAGKNYLICVANEGGGGNQLFCVDAGSGEVVWQDRSADLGKPSFGGHFTPTLVGDVAVVGHLAAFKLTLGKAELLWKAKERGGSGYGFSPVVHDGYGYSGTNYKSAICIDCMTGEIKWKVDGHKEGFFQCFGPVQADGKLFFWKVTSREKSFAMIRATPDKFEVLGSFLPPSLNPKIAACPSTSPAIVGGRLYLRQGDCVACYDLTEAGNP